jgi:uncharacterized protein (TIGR03086 family)
MNVDVLRHTQGIAAGVLANVSADQLDAPTPCASWTVADLIDHMVGAQHWSRCGVQGATVDDSGEGSAQGDFNATFAQAAEAAAAAFAEDGALDRTVNPGFGDMPAAALLGLAITDTFTHAWDLAKATGQDTDLDPALAAQLLAASRQAIQPAFRGPEGAPFGPEQTAPEGASAADELAAFLGRQV